MPDNDNDTVTVDEMDVSQLANHCADKLSIISRWIGGKTILGEKRFIYISHLDDLGVCLSRLKTMALELQARVDESAKIRTVVSETVVTETPVNGTEGTVTQDTVTVVEESLTTA